MKRGGCAGARTPILLKHRVSTEWSLVLALFVSAGTPRFRQLPGAFRKIYARREPFSVWPISDIGCVLRQLLKSLPKYLSQCTCFSGCNAVV